MLCVSLNNKSVEGCLKEMAQACRCESELMFEIRADLCDFNVAQIKELFKLGHNDARFLVTCRLGEQERTKKILETAILSGADYVDLEMEASDDLSDYIRLLSIKHGCKYIVSYHNFNTTPSTEYLLEIYQKALSRGADIVKIVTTAQNLEQASKITYLYHSLNDYIRFNNLINKPLVAFTMGEETKFTRELCLRLGAPFTYVSMDDKGSIAPGQWSLSEMLTVSNAENFSFRLSEFVDSKFSAGKLKIPASKSIAQRAILASALATEGSVLHGLNEDLSREAQDVQSAATFVKKISVNVWNVGESGLLARLALPLAMYYLWKNPDEDAQIQIKGEGTLLSRSFEREFKVLEGLGLEIFGGHLPVTLKKNSVDLSRGTFSIDASQSSQMASGFLMMLPLLMGDLKRDLTLVLNRPTSLPYIDLTLEVLRKFGVRYECERVCQDMNQRDIKEIRYCLKAEGNNSYAPADVEIEADWSSAAYFLVASAIMKQEVASGQDLWLKFQEGLLEKMGLKLGTSQADEAIWELLKKGLISFNFDATQCPDLFPILVVLAAHCDGESRISGLSRLYNKESNRALAILTEFSVMGYGLRVEGNDLVIYGSKYQAKSFKKTYDMGQKAFLRTYNDHRMAMSLAIAALFSEKECYIDNSKCVGKSFPDFFSYL